MKFPPEFVDKVRDANNIMDVIGTHVHLTRSGNSFRGLCPFPNHAERTPSFFVSETKQVYHCFGCQKSGNVFTFLMDFNGMSFPDAVIELADRANIPLPETKDSKPADRSADDQAKLNFKVNKYVATYWYKNLSTKPKDHPANKYIAKRNLSPEIIEEFKIGFSDEGWHGLTEVLTKAKAPLHTAEKLGLIKKRADGKYFDIFRNRLMFPIISANGNVLGFGGRTIDETQQPKYLNSPESPTFNKSRTLYGLHATAKYIRAEKEAILVEGYMDLVSLYQFGIKNVIATLGTAFTAEHARAIQKLTHKVVVVFDNDDAGRAASERSLPFLLDAGVLSRCLVLKGAKDPDEFIRTHSVEEFTELMKNAPDHFSVFLSNKMEGFRGRATDKVEVLDSVTPMLNRVKDQQLRRLYLQEVADRLNIDTSTLTRVPGGERPQASKITKENEKSPNLETIPKEEKLLVQFMLVDHEYLDRVRNDGVIESFASVAAKKLAQRIVERYCQNPSDFDKLAASILGSGLGENSDEVGILKEALSIFSNEGSAARALEKEEQRRLLEDCIAKVKQRSLKTRSKEILNALKTQNSEEVLIDFMKIVKEQKGPQRR